MNSCLIAVVVLLGQADGIVEGAKAHGAHVQESVEHATLKRLASEHAQYMARVGVQGHQGFERRAQAVRSELRMGAAEICAESWPWQANDTPKQLWSEMFKCWGQSAGHWSVASKKHRYYGAAMAKSKRGVWYACIIVAD